MTTHHTTEVILAPDVDGVVSLAQSAENFRNDLLGTTKPITTVSTTEVRDRVINVAAELRGYLNHVEKRRVEVKAPFYRMGNLIDDFAKNHVHELQSELTRLNRLIGEFNHQQSEKEREERNRLQREADDLRRKQEQEAAELAKKKFKSEVKRDAAELDFQARQEAIDKERNQLLAKQQQQALSAEKSKPSGGAQRFEVTVEVTDIRKLYAEHPLCVRLTADLAMIKAMAARGMELPGVKITRTPIFSTRGTTQGALR